MGQSQAYKRRHPGRRGQISAQEYTGLTFRWIAAASAEGEDSRGPGSREQGQSGQARPHNSQGKDRQHRRSEAGQEQSTGTGGQQGDTAGQAHTPRTADRATRHAGQARQQRDEAGQGQAAGSTGQRAIILNMRHTETSNCAIVVAWQESERGRARQGSTPTHQLVERDSREAVSFVLLSDICGRRPPGQRGRA